MKENVKKKLKKKGNLYRNFVELIFVGSVTGIFAGAIVTAFSLLVHEGEKISQDAYAYVRANPAFLPLLFAALLAAAFLVSVAVNISTVVRGGGVPQAEGASRGSVPLKWWRDLPLMFAATLVNVFAGLSVGAEGPSVLIGACTGEGVSRALKRGQMIEKYQITGGACAGLAVAMNAPLMGMAFAFEEAHKRFTPEVFICAFTSVIFGLLTRFAVYGLLGMEVVNAFSSYLFYELPISNYLYVVGAAVICSVLGVAFYKLCFFFRRRIRKVRLKNMQRTLAFRVTLAVMVGGVVSLLAPAVMGGGQQLIEGFGTFGGLTQAEIPSALGLTFIGSVCVILLLKFFVISFNVGAGIPCGIFIPLLAIGACIGALVNQGLLALGMQEKYCDILLMICMATFFTTVVKAPITSIVMVCELTGSFAPLLPVIIGVSIGYMIGELSKTDGIYEQLLEEYEKDTGLREREVQRMFTLDVVEGALADGRRVCDVLWPAGVRVKELRRGEEVILPNGATVLHHGDTLIIVSKSIEPERTLDELTHILH